jgi:hypothetical protein
MSSLLSIGPRRRFKQKLELFSAWHLGAGKLTNVHMLCHVLELRQWLRLAKSVHNHSDNDSFWQGLWIASTWERHHIKSPQSFLRSSANLMTLNPSWQPRQWKNEWKPWGTMMEGFYFVGQSALRPACCWLKARFNHGSTPRQKKRSKGMPMEKDAEESHLMMRAHPVIQRFWFLCV